MSARTCSIPVNLATHVTDIVNVIKWESLSSIVLVGHSYGGVIISGVAEQVPKAIGSIVYLDAFVPENGEALVTLTTRRWRGSRLSAQRTSPSLLHGRVVVGFIVGVVSLLLGLADMIG